MCVEYKKNKQQSKRLNIYIAFSIIFSLNTIVGAVDAQSRYKLTIDELLDKGLQHSISVQSTDLKLNIADDKVALAKNKRLPDIQVAGQFGYVGQSTVLDTDLSYKSHPQSPDWKQNYQVSAIQPIYQGGRIKNNIKKADLEKEIAEISLSKDKSNIKLWLINKYLDLYNLYGKQKIYQFNIDEAKVRLNNILKMREEGMITSNDVLRSKIQLTDYELSYNEVVNDITLLSQQLAIALDMDEDIIYEPDSIFLNTKPQTDNSIEDYVQIAYQNYPDMQIARTNIDLAKNSLKITKADYLPNLSLQLSNTFQRPIPNTSPVQDLYINSWGVTLSLSYRISALFDRKHSLSAAKGQINLQELAEEQQKQNIRISVKTYYLKHQEALDRVKTLETSLKQSDENYRIMNTKYFNQLAILTDLLDANNLQLNAELQLTSAKTNAIYTYYQLLNICGKL